ncbi:uncharacterized protein [Phyllobates terribilis]|uniref:uncharacterized protein n=1 Tax=Phyllobates terribilis TaxID=111132 RepID=UPI003CCAAB63
MAVITPRASCSNLIMKVKRAASGEKDSGRLKLKTTTSKTKKRSNAILKKIEAHKPKKPPTAFFFFLDDFRKDFQKQNPEVKNMRDIGKACGVKWKTMTYEEKVEYYDIAAQKRVEFDRAMADHIKKMETGEYDQTYKDSELDEDDEEYQY